MKKIIKVEKINKIELSSKKLSLKNEKGHHNESKKDTFRQILEEKLDNDKIKVRKKF